MAVERSPMLMPPDMLEWLPRNHFVYMLLQVVESLDLSRFEASYRLGGVGRQAYDPKMLVALLVYAYSQGVSSSRRIEQKCHTDVAFRVICGNNPPDHCAVARFRQRCSSQFASLFSQVLGVCASIGMMKVGVVSIDGTKIGGNASLQANHSQEKLQRIAEELVAKAALVDAAEDEEFGDRCGDELPDGWEAGPDRAAKLRGLVDKQRRVEQALGQAEQAAPEEPPPVKDATAMEVAKRQLKTARGALDREFSYARNRRLHAGRVDCRGAPRKPLNEHVRVAKAVERVIQMQNHVACVEAEVEAKQRNRKPVKLVLVNLTDPESTPMPSHGGWVQGYNGQIAVSDDHVIIAADVTTSTNDAGSFIPMMGLAVASVDEHKPGDEIGMLLGDAGYCSETALQADGPDRLIAVGRDPAKNKASRVSPVILAMGERLKPGTPGRETYKRRGATVETVFGNVKQTLGFRRFTRRGLQAAKDEWMLIAAVFNLRRIAVNQGIALP